jgi:hypothetical protein
MYKFFLYFILVIIYLGLAKALSPSEIGVQYLKNEKEFSQIIKNPMATVILIDTHATGFLIKTYYQKYRVIAGYDTVEELIMRTSKEFARKNLAHIGLSLYRRIDNKEEYIPVPPGSIYINRPEFGRWKKNKSGIIKWSFNKSFKNFPRYLGWGKFRPDEDFYQELKSSIALNKPYFGKNHEFGPEGKITQKNFPHFFKDDRKKKIELQTLLIEYLKENF